MMLVTKANYTDEISRLPQEFQQFKIEDIEQSISSRFEQQVSRYPQKLAVKTYSECLTYERLNRAANRVARSLVAREGDLQNPVPILFEHGASMLIAMLGILKAGRAWVPIDPSYPPDRIDFIVKSCQNSLLVTNERNLSLAREVMDDERVQNIDRLDDSIADNNLELAISPDALAFILYTSGSTGQPKGVVHNHRNLLHLVRGGTNDLQICDGDRLVLLSSYCHIVGVNGIFRALLNGAACLPYNIKENGLGGLANWLSGEEATIYHSVPTVFRHFIDTLSPKAQFPHLRAINLGGEVVSKRDIESYKRYFPSRCIFLNHLGCTEISSYRQYFLNKSTKIDFNILPAGYAAADKQVLIVDENGEAINDGRIGEIVVKSPYLALGYWQRPDLTAAAFEFQGSESLYRTGDLGYLLLDGCLINLGRKDSQVKIRGYRVEIGEIEGVLLEHPNVKEAAVRDWDKDGEKFLVAYIVAHSRQTISPAAIRSFLEGKLPQYMVPATFVILDALPLTATGKVNHRLLLPASEYQQNSARVVVEPQDDIELQIAKIWQKFLGVSSVGIKDKFADLGGHSLLEMRVISEIEKKFNAKLTLTAATIEEQANYIRDRQSPQGALEANRDLLSSAVVIQPEGTKTPIFCIHVLGEGLKFYQPMIKYLGNERPLYGLNAQLAAKEITTKDRVEGLAAYYIEEMRAIQCEGPYYLFGVSFGGKVAFEMASQLQLQGQEVALLALLDTSAPGAIRKLSTQERIVTHWHNYTQLGCAYLLSKLGDFVSGKFKNLRRQLEERSKIAYSKYCLAFGHPLSQSLHNFTINRQNIQISKSWTPQTYSGKVTLFRAMERSIPVGCTCDSQLGWGKFATGELEVHQIPGSHLGMLQEPNIRFLAEKLKDCLNLV